jgi:hypothetical protein
MKNLIADEKKFSPTSIFWAVKTEIYDTIWLFFAFWKRLFFRIWLRNNLSCGVKFYINIKKYLEFVTKKSQINYWIFNILRKNVRNYPKNM